MTDRPILFSGPMVRAILDGRKTQTRRVASLYPTIDNRRFSVFPPEALIELEPGEFRAGVCHYQSTAALSGPYTLPYAVGDRLWVREACAIVPATAYRQSEGVFQTVDPSDPDYAAIYREGWERSKPGRWRPSIHMPRWANRLTLIIEDVRVERVADISDDDCFAEGISGEEDAYLEAERAQAAIGHCQPYSPEKWAFMDLWNSLNAKRGYGWDANPWVVAITFRTIKQNIDAAKEAA